MNRATVLLVAALFACGGKSSGPPLAPLPPDQPPAKPDPEPPKPVAPTPPPAPAGPLELKITPPTPTVKLISPGRGKRVALKVAPTAGAKQQVELAFDFGVEQSMAGESQNDIVPTVVLAGTAETVGVGDDGTADYAITIDKADAREVTGTKVPIAKFKEVVSSTVGLKMSGKVGSHGDTGEVTLRIEKQAEATAQVLDLVRLTFPGWPAFPTQPIAPGAKWQATLTTKLADRLDITMVTDYTLVSYKNKVWTIKGTIKVTGADQMMQGGKITKITGSGTSEIAMADGALFPSHKTAMQTTFTASEADPKTPNPASLDFKISVGGSITAK